MISYRAQNFSPGAFGELAASNQENYQTRENKKYNCIQVKFLKTLYFQNFKIPTYNIQKIKERFSSRFLKVLTCLEIWSKILIRCVTWH